MTCCQRARDVVAPLAGALAGVRCLFQVPAAAVQRCLLGTRVSAVLLAVLDAECAWHGVCSRQQAALRSGLHMTCLCVLHCSAVEVCAAQQKKCVQLSALFVASIRFRPVSMSEVNR